MYTKFIAKFFFQSQTYCFYSLDVFAAKWAIINFSRWTNFHEIFISLKVFFQRILLPVLHPMVPVAISFFHCVALVLFSPYFFLSFRGWNLGAGAWISAVFVVFLQPGSSLIVRNLISASWIIHLEVARELFDPRQKSADPVRHKWR